MPVATAFGKKIRTLSAGKEIAEQQHEDLFLWLTQNLEEVVRDLWNADPDKLEKASVEAMKNWRSEAQSKLDQLTSIAKKYQRNNPDIAKQAIKCEKAANAIVASLQPWQMSEEFGNACLGNWAAQQPVREDPSDNRLTLGYRRANEPPSKIIGYVDVAAAVDVVVDIALKPSMGPENSEDAYVSMMAEVISRRGGDEEWLDRLKAWRPVTPYWEAKRQHMEVWFDIRAQPFVVGEMLRELRTLRESLPHSTSATSFIALVVPHCADQARTLLIHEGFLVVSRGDFESRRLNEVSPADEDTQRPRYKAGSSDDDFF
jgi:hypothetical protein